MTLLTIKQSEHILKDEGVDDNLFAMQHAPSDALIQRHSDFILHHGDGWDNARAMEYATDDQKQQHCDAVIKFDVSSDVDGDVAVVFAMEYASPDQVIKLSDRVIEKADPFFNCRAMSYTEKKQHQRHSDKVLESQEAECNARAMEFATPKQKQKHSDVVFLQGDTSSNAHAATFSVGAMKIRHEKKAEKLQNNGDCLTQLQSNDILSQGDPWSNVWAMDRSTGDNLYRHSQIVFNSDDPWSNVFALGFSTFEMQPKHSSVVIDFGSAYENAKAMEHTVSDLQLNHSDAVLNADASDNELISANVLAELYAVEPSIKCRHSDKINEIKKQRINKKKDSDAHEPE